MTQSRAVPFRVDIAHKELQDLRGRLINTRWPEDFANESWKYGVERTWLQEMVRYWVDTYDWRAHEAAMNAYDHFKVEIDDIPLHFLHVRGNGPAPTPLILCHGWPWTFWDMRKIIGPLSDPAKYGGDPADAFDIVVPSLPGFGFSTPLRTGGVDVRRIAVIFKTLMADVLGYDRFGAYGGDFGSLIAFELGHAHADRTLGISVNTALLPGLPPRDIDPGEFAPDEQWMVERMAVTARLNSHTAIQTRDPQTLAYGLTDSPVGTAAWIWERRRAWSDNNGDVFSVFSRDDLITDACIYWLNGSIATSMRLYYEQFHKPWLPIHDRMPTIGTPTAFALFPKEMLFIPKRIALLQTNLARWSILPAGGHFPPAEQPDVLVDEIRAHFRELR